MEYTIPFKYCPQLPAAVISGLTNMMTAVVSMQVRHKIQYILDLWPFKGLHSNISNQTLLPGFSKPTPIGQPLPSTTKPEADTDEAEYDSDESEDYSYESEESEEASDSEYYSDEFSGSKEE